MIPDLTSAERSFYLDRIKKSGIHGLEGIKVFHARQLRDCIEALISKELHKAAGILDASPDYHYPPEIPEDKQLDYWLDKSNFHEYKRALKIVDEFLKISDTIEGSVIVKNWPKQNETQQTSKHNPQETSPPEHRPTKSEEDVRTKVEKSLYFMLGTDQRKHKVILNESDFGRLVDWVTFYFDNDFKIPEINQPIRKVNTNKGNVFFAFKDLYKSLFPAGTYPDSLFELIKSCFFEYQNDKISNMKKVKEPQYYSDLKRNKY